MKVPGIEEEEEEDETMNSDEEEASTAIADENAESKATSPKPIKKEDGDVNATEAIGKS